MINYLKYIFFLIIGYNLILSQSYQRVDFWLTLQDGTRLDCTKFIPNGSPPGGGWRCMIITHGYGLTKYYEMPTAEELAAEGYYTLVYSMRGQGISEGESNFISMTEANDLKQVVQYVKNDLNTNDNRIGINGGSQGGIILFMAACTGMQVRMIMPDMASPTQGSDWIENGCIKMVFLWTASYPPNIVRYNPTVSRFRSWILSSSPDKWDSLAYYLPQNRDFLHLVQNCQLPIYIQNAWQDRFFNTLGVINCRGIIPANLYKMYFGVMDGHGSDYIDDEEEYKDVIFKDWLDYYLKGINNNVMNPAQKFTYSVSHFPVQARNFWSWTRYHSPSWPPSGIQNIRFYFHPNNYLSNWGYYGSQTNVSFNNDVLDPNVTMEFLVNTEFRGPLFESKFRKNQIVFDSAPLQQDVIMAGTPSANLFYSSTANGVCQFNIQIWEAKLNGEEKLVTRLNWTDRYYSSGQVKEKFFNGQAYGHRFSAGNKIRIRITNLDNVPMYTSGGDTTDYFLRTNPFVLPVLKSGTNRIYINNNSRSYIDLPLMNYIIGIKQISSEIPLRFELHQNYPNPFNPETKIKFAVNEYDTYTLKVFDIYGKVLKIILHSYLSPGIYETEFNASEIASGLYIYRLEGKNFSASRKMVVLK
ncbi:MAG: T9SS type A sorting domain-containing protein [Ignavibacteria bacterium]|nr:T9SS type A sorting domain-containing protein [Ignavibacteria bacterium]